MREYRRDGEDALRPKPKDRRPRNDSAAPPGEASELEQPRRENELLRAEIAYLGKIAGLEGARTTARVLAVVSLKADHRLTDLLDAAGLARSTFFYHQARPAAPDPQADLKAALTAVFTTNYGRYGHRRVHGELVKAGWQVAKKTALKLMRELRLVCRVPSAGGDLIPE